MQRFSIGTLFLCSTALSAAPVVKGNTISWPEDGWYQVQNASDYSQVCAGVKYCTVEAGTYIVINHTTGKRFDRVVVGGEVEESNISVSDGVISWPDNGWYQVQRSDTYESVCNGGKSCAVDNGTYTVINHTTGQRYPDIVVSANTPPQTESITVEGKTISWPNDGWYQVQTVPSYESVCNGGSSCTVEPGDYVVFNHSNNTRTNITVAGGDPVAPSEAAINSGNYKAVISSVLMVYTGTSVNTSVLFAPPTFAAADSSQGPGKYDCERGGSVTVENYITTRSDGFSYEFDQCGFGAMTIEGDRLVYNYLGAQFAVSENYTISGTGPSGSYLADSFSGTAAQAPGQWSAEDFDYYHSNFNIAISKGDYSWSRVVGSGGSFSTDISGGFSYRYILGGVDAQLTVQADAMSMQLSPQDTQALQGSYEYLDATPFMAVQPKAGTILIVADDDSKLLMNAATGDMSTVSITIENEDENISLLENWSNWNAELRINELGASR